MIYEIEIHTNKEFEIIDITSEVQKIVKESNIQEGIAVVFTKHTTTALIVNENEKRLLSDIEMLLENIAPRGKGYKHDRIDNNAHSHLRAILLNPSITIPIKDGKLELGTWQSILFVELDGPRLRKILVKLCTC
ncbi:secondary thiamine-phosphate synthase enzyme YjbQ [Thermococcus sp. LS2]|uniref:secondary thiamine-phosphate synthase enzyme YjbQ n=1 Tax=Thermococcus sp. LS2 TaxID=1638260 RepID=UPI001438A181|nr:secondary thiamine-phosphate synthase enzyme YjbQ [Thermococcus sp. LS2]NJE12258.1 YjbQ family protein [Thermococcus sp. LS2]